jgi:hypothetical protein
VVEPPLPVLPVLRSVQGDLGMRSDALSVLETDREWLLQTLAVDEETALATACTFHALRRHCGRLTITSRPNQPARIATDGPDLRSAPLVVGTGGILVRTPDGRACCATR